MLAARISIAPMAHELRTDPALALVEVVYRGPTGAAERAKAIHEGARLLSELGFRRVLVDLREATIAVEPTHVLAGLAHHMAHAPAVGNSRLAYLVSPEQEANRIIENMASARHMRVERFHQREAALAWLLEEPPAADAGADD